MKNYSNRGMFLESIIINSADYLKNNNLCLIFKRDLPLKVCSVNGNEVKAKFCSKSYSDFYATYYGYFFDFEAKQTEDDSFRLSNIKEHQFNHLKLINDFNGFSFLLIYFVKYDEYFAIDFNQLSTIYDRSKIEYGQVKEIGYQIEFKFPGILCLDKYFKYLIDRKNYGNN